MGGDPDEAGDAFNRGTRSPGIAPNPGTPSSAPSSPARNREVGAHPSQLPPTPTGRPRTLPPLPTPRQCLPAGSPAFGQAAAPHISPSFVARATPSLGPSGGPYLRPSSIRLSGQRPGEPRPPLLRPGRAGGRGCCGPSLRGAAHRLHPLLAPGIPAIGARSPGLAPRLREGGRRAPRSPGSRLRTPRPSRAERRAEPAEPAEPAARLREETKGAGAGAGAGGRGLGRAGGGWAGQARAGGLAVLRPQCRAESKRAGGKRGATSSPSPRSISFPSQAAGVIGGASGVLPHPPPRWAPGDAYIAFGETHPPAMLCLQRCLGSLGRTAAWKESTRQPQDGIFLQCLNCCLEGICYNVGKHLCIYIHQKNTLHKTASCAGSHL
nr:translation initiation factor IF-2-like [Macaca fascicularis]